MAKKMSKKVGKKIGKAGGTKTGKPATKRGGTKPAKKGGAKQAGKGKAGVNPMAPVGVSTGGGASPAEIGGALVSMFNRGEWKQIEDKYWSPAVVSIEGVGVAMAWHGRKAVEGKNAWWQQDHVIHGASAEGPYVGATGFSVRFRMDVETKSTGQRETMEEVGVYTVKNGKIVQEEFMYLAR